MVKSPNFQHFWPRYLREHAAPGTRLLHYLGTGLGIVALVWAAATQTWAAVILMPILGYGFAWTAHAFVERNKPATFTHPLWSLMGDYRMFALWLTGRLGPALEEAGVPEVQERRRRA